MASKEAEDYYENIEDTDRILALRSILELTASTVPSAREVITNAFDAGVKSVNKRIKEINDYYNQLNGKSEDYRAGYLQAEKDMPTQSEAAFEIIRMQKKLDALEEQNRWHSLKENPNDLPPAQEYDIDGYMSHWKWYLVKTDYTYYKNCKYAICARILRPSYSTGSEEPNWLENTGDIIGDQHIFEWKEII